MGKTRASYVPPQSHNSPQPHQERSASPPKDADPLKIAAQPNDPITSTSSDPLAAIAARLDMIEELRDKVNALEAQLNRRRDKAHRYTRDSDEDPEPPWRTLRRLYPKIDFPKFEGGDPRGWILKADKFFRYYNTPEEEKVDVAAFYLEGDALDLFSWLNSQHTVRYWTDLTYTLEEHFGPPEFLNPNEHLCLIRKTGTVQEYRQEWARRVARVSDWPEHCLLGVFLTGLNESL